MTQVRKDDKIFPALVVKLIDEYTVVINRGSDHEMEEGKRFLIYSISPEEILDPITKESLGHLEIVKGKGKIIHIQEKISIIESCEFGESSERKIIRKKNPFNPFSLIEQEEIITPSSEIIPIPFDNVEVGDFVKPI